MPSEMLDEKAIFNVARQIGSQDAREEYLRQACGTDAGLRERVRVLLHAYEEQASFLESPPAAGAIPTVDHSASGSPGTVVGPYKLLEQIGEGGMGTVWMAQQTEPVKRLVALKLIKAGMDSRQVIARFEAERQALALMDHPNIAKVHDAGSTADGRPYFVMELVKGQSITKYCDEHRLTPRQRLELFLPVCQAIQHAHQKGIIHRDLKPSNVLVALYDGKPVPKVIDFGVAKAAWQPLTEKTLVTGLGAVVGTPEYMSPEQAELNQLDIDTRSDIYSLGVLLYELLTGTTPLTRKRFKEAALLEVLRVIREEEPQRPSTRISTTDELPSIAANRGTEPARLTRLLRGELDWIVMKSLEKDRSRRYESANGFAMDLQRYLAGEAVLAVPPSVWYRFRKFACRNRPQLLMAAALGFLLIGAAAFAWHADRQAASRSRDERVRLGRNAEAVAALLDQCEAALAGDGAERADQASVALSAAERRASEGGAEELADRLAHCRADLDLLRELEAIEQFRRSQTNGVPPEYKAVAARWQAALAAYGIRLDAGSLAETATRVNGSLLRDQLLTILDMWLKAEGSSGVRAILRAADPDPYRDAVRDAWAARNFPEVAALARQPEALEQPPGFALVLGRSNAYTLPAERKRQILMSALRARPRDRDIYFSLGLTYFRPAGADERVRWFQAAVVAYPKDPNAHNYLGFALEDKDDFSGAAASYREAARLDPNFPGYHVNLGIALLYAGDGHGAIRSFQEAIRQKPTMFVAHVGLAWTLAVGPDDVRDGRRAIEHALRACEMNNWKSDRAIDTLAAAYAELGDFDRAVELQKTIVGLPGLRKDSLEYYRERLELYTRKKPYRLPAFAPREAAPPPREVKT